jgi:hypothetical protein
LVQEKTSKDDKTIQKGEGNWFRKRDKVLRGLHRTTVLIAHRERDSAQAQSCNMMKTKIQEERLECGNFWEDWCLTATIRYATSTQDGIGLTAWPTFNVFCCYCHLLAFIWAYLVLCGVE